MTPFSWKKEPPQNPGRFRTLAVTCVCAFSEKRYNACMNNISIADILELPVQERIRLVELIWDSVAAVPEAVEISPALKVELEARLAEFEANPEAGYSWDQVKSSLKDGSWRTA
ncbi:MAG: addiction module protein [Acidithiobacillus sp.]